MDKEAVAARVKLSREAILKLLLFAAIAWLVFGLISFFLPPLLRWNFPTLAASIEPGTFGDMFGAGNAFFSALAFGAVAYTLWLQTQELEEARAERREARQDSKENIKLQGEIAESQRAAAAMQLKVAQSGDVYAVYARVAGSGFSTRLERLKWLEWSYGTETDFDAMEHCRIPFNRLYEIMNDAQRREPPPHYSTQTVLDAEIPAGNLAVTVIAARVTEDVQYCLSAIVDLGPALKLGLLEPAQIRKVLGLTECRFALSCAQNVSAINKRQLKLGEEFYDMLSGGSAAAGVVS